MVEASKEAAPREANVERAKFGNVGKVFVEGAEIIGMEGLGKGRGSKGAGSKVMMELGIFGKVEGQSVGAVGSEGLEEVS
jgi:hypothetical protein